MITQVKSMETYKSMLFAYTRMGKTCNINYHATLPFLL